MKQSLFHHKSGSTLLLVLWAVAVLSMATVAWVEWIQQDIEFAGIANHALEARALAHSGIAIALHPQVTKASPVLYEEAPGDRGFRVKMISEGGKLNIKYLLDGEQPQRLAILKLWMDRRGIGLKERDILIDCMLDYTDVDNVKHNNGVEDQGDYHSPNRPFLSVDEIAQVWGSEPLTSTPGWQDDLTVDSQGPIDVVAAKPEILQLIGGLNETAIQNFIKMRAGEDGIEGTEDDPKITMNEFKRFFGISGGADKILADILTTDDPVLHITSEGRSGKVIRQVDVVARKNNGPAQILSWKE